MGEQSMMEVPFCQWANLTLQAITLDVLLHVTSVSVCSLTYPLLYSVLQLIHEQSHCQIKEKRVTVLYACTRT